MAAQMVHHPFARNGVVPSGQVVKAVLITEILLVSADHQLGSVFFGPPDHLFRRFRRKRIVCVHKADIDNVKVIGVPSDFFGEEVAACVTLKDGATFDEAAAKAELILFCIVMLAALVLIIAF